MNIYLSKKNIITIAITAVMTTLFVVWGLYLMRDKPVTPPDIPPKATSTVKVIENTPEQLQKYRKLIDDATTTGSMEIFD